MLNKLKSRPPERTHKTLKSPPQERTHFLWWCAAVLCALITTAVIIAGIVVFIGYLVIHPRVPVISVMDASLPHFNYDGAGILVTQVNIVLRSKNDNMKAHASFSDLDLMLYFAGTKIAELVAGPYEVKKNDSAIFNYEAVSAPIPLSPEQMEEVDIYLKEDEVKFDLKGGVRARWKVGVLGSVRFLCHLNCQLRFHQSNGSYIPNKRCTSSAK